MGAIMLEPLLRNATIKAIDGVAKKVRAAERNAEGKLARLLTTWEEMEPADKEQVVAIAIATISTAVTAIVALRRKPMKRVAKKAKKVVRKTAGKVVRKVVRKAV